MARYTLENNFEFDFLLFSIVCHESEYRLCSAINRAIGIDLGREKNLELKNKKQADPLNFSVFSCFDEDLQNEFILVNNLSSNAVKSEEKSKAPAQAGLFDEVAANVNFKRGRLIPEADETDFFLLIRGDVTPAAKSNLLKQLGALEVIRNVKAIDPESLASKNNLLF